MSYVPPPSLLNRDASFEMHSLCCCCTFCSDHSVISSVLNCPPSVTFGGDPGSFSKLPTTMARHRWLSGFLLHKCAPYLIKCPPRKNTSYTELAVRRSNEYGTLCMKSGRVHGGENGDQDFAEATITQILDLWSGGACLHTQHTLYDCFEMLVYKFRCRTDTENKNILR